MKIRIARKDDFPGIRRLIKMYPEKLMQAHLPRVGRFFVVIEDGKIVGCCALEIYSKRLAEIRSLSVEKKYHGRGIAIELIKHCLKRARKKGVYEVLAITGAKGLFEKFGFHAFHKEKFALLKIL